MALATGQEWRIAWRYTYFGQKCENVQTYLVAVGAGAVVSPVQFLEALWNDYKGRFHAVMSDNAAVNTFDSLLGQEIGGALQFGEYPIPLGDQLGTRGGGDVEHWLNSFTCSGTRQTVGTRLTRPGQKRFPFILETDVKGQTFEVASLALFDALGGAFSQSSVLGAPALLVVANPQVVHEPGARDPVRHLQPVTGWVTSQYITSQVSRKQGRGA